MKFAGEEEEPVQAAPEIGEHNAQIYADLAIDSGELERLRTKGVI